MLNQERVFDVLAKHGVTFFTGVPDSYLNGFCNYALNNCGSRNIIAANEGNAVGIASGHYFATKEIPLVYMQNSGLGNTVNPLVSLVDKDVYAVPMLLLVGWRGQGNSEPNHPQHKLQGEITPELLEIILNNMPENTIYSVTTGRATRELFFLREKRGETKAHDFLNVGSMGHASSVAFGIALERLERKVVALDGDSACMMHMGAMTMVSKLDAPNFMHIVLNNGAHESVGGQPSAGHKVDFTKIAEACGYTTVGHPVTTKVELKEALEILRDCSKASFIDCRIHKGLSRKLPPIVFEHRKVINDLIDDLNE